MAEASVHSAVQPAAGSTLLLALPGPGTSEILCQERERLHLWVGAEAETDLQQSCFSFIPHLLADVEWI